MKRNYKSEILSLEENLEILKGELYIFQQQAKKLSGKKARQVLLNMRKICNCMRIQILEAIKALPKRPRIDSPASLDAAKIKRKATMEAKKARKQVK